MLWNPLSGPPRAFSSLALRPHCSACLDLETDMADSGLVIRIRRECAIVNIVATCVVSMAAP